MLVDAGEQTPPGGEMAGVATLRSDGASWCPTERPTATATARAQRAAAEVPRA